MARLPASHPFPARDCRIDIKRVDLDAVAEAARALRGNDRRPAATKGIDNNVGLLCNVEQGVSDKRDRLDGRVQLNSPLAALARKAIGAGVIPDVGAIAPEAAELDVVAMLLLAIAEHEDEFMPRAIKRAHAAVALDPDAEI